MCKLVTIEKQDGPQIQMAHSVLSSAAAAASEAVALFNIPENAARLQAAQNECESLN